MYRTLTRILALLGLVLAGIKVGNPSGTQPFYAQVFGKWYEIEPGGSIDEDDPSVVATLGDQYGAVVDQHQLRLALEQAGDAAREHNSQTASASASEGEILSAQATVDPVTGAVTADLKGKALTEALRSRGLPVGGTADEKRARLGAAMSGSAEDEETTDQVAVAVESLEEYDLDVALSGRELDTDGTVEEKRARLLEAVRAEEQAAQEAQAQATAEAQAAAAQAAGNA